MMASCCLNSHPFTHHAPTIHTEMLVFSAEMYDEVKAWQRKLH